MVRPGGGGVVEEGGSGRVPRVGDEDVSREAVLLRRTDGHLVEDGEDVALVGGPGVGVGGGGEHVTDAELGEVRMVG